MVWLLLACFGYSSKKRKRLRPARHVHSVDNADQGSYELLKGSPTSPVVLGSAPDQERDCNPTRSNLKIRRRSSCGNQGRVVTRKKVRFDLNVVKYEPIPAHCDDDDENQDDGIVEFEEKEEDDDVSDDDEGSLEDFLLGLSGSRIVRSIHGNYRYSNCYEDDDEEEEITFEADDDLDQKDQEGEEEGICIFDPRGVYDDELSNSSDLLPSKAAPYHEKDPSAVQDSGSLEGQSARSQSLYDVMKNPVLIPIENLHQWKTMKAKKLQPVA